jgi:dolichol-phosphate mannosyltransferase
MEKRRELFSSKTVKQSVVYTLVGILTAIMNVVFLYVLTEYLGFYYMASAVIAAIFMSFVGFGLHKRITFREKLKGNFLNQYIKFSAITISVFFLNMFFLFSFTEFAGIFYPISQVISLLLGGVFSFLAGKFYIFPE